MKRAALYARVSTQRQEQEEKIESQIDEIKTRITQDDHTLVEGHVYQDDGYSGTLLARPDLDRLRDDARKGLFDVLYVYDRGRLARIFAHQEVIIEELGDLGIEFVSLHDVAAATPEEQVMQAMQGVFHEFERVKIAERMRRGKMHKVKEGKKLLGYNPPYGYDYVPIQRQGDQKVNGRFVINQAEARVVKKIFQWVGEEGVSMREVIRRLQALGIPPRKQKRPTWTKGPVVRLLQNETYVGKHYYNKTESVVTRRPSNGEKQYHRIKKTSRRVRPRDEWLPVKVPAIVSKEIFKKAQHQLADNVKFAVRNGKHPYLLVGLVYCPCGKRRTGDGPDGKKYYRCTDRLQRFPLPRTCSSSGANAQVLDVTVWNKLVELMTDKKLVRAHAEQWVAKRKVRPTELSEDVQEELKQLSEEEQRYAKAYGEGVMPFETYKDFAENIKQKRKALRAQADEDRKPMTGATLSVEDMVAGTDSWLPKFDFDDRRAVTRRVIKKVIAERDKVTVCGQIPLSQVGFEPIDRHRRSSQRR